MGRILTPLISFTLTLFIAIPTAQAQLGFQEITDKEIPQAVRDDASAVMFLVVFNSKPTFTISAKDYESSLKKEKELGGLQAKFISERLQECKDQALDSCPVYVGFFASAFIAESNSQLWTIAHVFSAMENTAESKLPNFLLMNQQGNILFDTRNGRDSAEVELISDDRELKKSLTIKEDAEKDYTLEVARTLGQLKGDVAKIRLNKKLDVTPLRFKTELPEKGSKNFILGYPDVTRNREKLGFRDSDGMGIKITQGETLDFFSSAKKLIDEQRRFPLDKKSTGWEMLKNLSQSTLITDADSARFMSGGPIVNSDGQVISIQSANFFATAEANDPTPVTWFSFGTLAGKDLEQMVFSTTAIQSPF